MICKKCGNEINADEKVCGKCGEAIVPESTKKGNFSIKIPQTKLEKENLANDFFKVNSESQPDKEKAPAENAEKQQKSKTAVATAEKPEVKVIPKHTKSTGEKSAENVKTTKSVKHPETKKTKIKEEKKTKASYMAIKVICCVCAVLTVALSCVSIFTDYLKADTSATKTVALSRLSETDKESFEEYFIKLSSVYGKEIDFSQMSIYDFLDLLKPADENGLYAAYFKKADVITKKADPTVRFTVSDSSCRYCRISADEVKTIATSLGIKLINSANNSDYYYYSADGCYYFAAAKSKAKSEAVSIKVSDSKRTESGSYYIECDVENGKAEKVYCLANMKKSDGITSWKVLRISGEPMFADDGTQIQTKTEGSIPYKMKYVKINSKTSSGVSYARYEISYPVFDDTNGSEEENKTARTLNLLYSDLIKAYRDKAAEADSDYAQYVKKGYVKSLLPGVVNIVSSVKYDKNGYISLLDEMSEYSPTEISKAAKKVVREAQKQGIKKSIKKEVVIPAFPTLTYSGYTINVETNEFMKKDEIFGKNYQPFSEKLFEIYTGYKPADGEAPTDDDGIGRAIYSSTWVLTENGVGFCYQEPLLYNNTVIIPYKYIDKKF